MSPPTPSDSPDRALTCFRLPAPSGAAQLMLVGALDLVTADRARDAIREAQTAAPELLCDLGDVWFVDLAGLRVLLDATAHARRVGGRLTVLSCPPIVPRMLRVLGLEDALTLRPAAAPAVPAATGHVRSRTRAR